MLLRLVRVPGRLAVLLAVAFLVVAPWLQAEQVRTPETVIIPEPAPEPDPDPPPSAPPPWFANVTSEAGLGGLMAFRLSVADVNADGYPDVFAHLVQNEGTGDVLNKQLLYLNVPLHDPLNPYKRGFIDYTAASGVRSNRQGTGSGRHSDAGIFADVDNDGDVDLFTGVYVHSSYSLDVGRNDLLLGDGHGHFQLAPNSPFHTEPIYNTAAETFLDYDRDGSLDLFIGNWYGPGNTLTADQLYRGAGSGAFTNVTASSGLSAGPTCVYGIAAFDGDGDGWTDLFATPYSHTVSGSTPRQWRNNGNGTFTQVQSSTGYNQYRGYGSGVASFGSMPRDYDGDGDADFIEVLTHGYGDGSSGVHTTTVTNNGGVWYWDFWRVTGRGSDDNDINHHGDHYASWLDYDGDGLSDFALTECCYAAPGGGENNRIYLFKQNPDHTFVNVTSSSGLGAINALGARVHNVLPLDYDLDGDEDLLVGFATGTHAVQLWRNELGAQMRWLALTLEGAGGAGRANRSAVGAKVEVTAGGVTQTREVAAGNGHQGPQTPLALTFGLGAATTVDTLRVRWPNQAGTLSELHSVASNQRLTLQERPAEVSCTVDLTNNVHDCGATPGVSFVVAPASGRTVLKVNLDPRSSGYTKALFTVQYGAAPTGFTVDIGDSSTNNGYGGDGATQSNDAETQVTDTTLTTYGKDGTPSQPLSSVPNFAFAGATVTFEVNNRRLAWDNHAGLAGSLASAYLYALNGQPDTEGPVNYDIYAAFNRAIYTWDRFGTGVIRVGLRLSAEPPSCTLDLVANTHTCAGIEAVQFVAPPAGGQAVMKVNLDRNDSGFTKAAFDVRYGAYPSGWTVNIGDSSTNNGGGGDWATQSRDAELDVYEGTFSVYGSDGTPTQPLLRAYNFADDWTQATFEVSDQALVYDNHDGTAGSLASPYLYALAGQPDSEGPVNWDVFAAFNRVIDGNYRSGSGVREVTLRLLTP